MGKYKQNHHYLIRQKAAFNMPIIKIFVLYESDSCYQIERENGYKSWELKSDWDDDYIIIDALGENYKFQGQ